MGIVSHELRTPLTVLLGALHTALLPELPEEEKRQLVEDGLWEAEALGRLLENLLELARFQAKRLELIKESVSVEAAAQNLASKFSSISPLHSLVLDIPPGLPETEADSIKVERVLQNLVDNAIKYSPRGGEIRVSARKDKEQLVVSVSDQGIGISAEDQPRLFNLFERLAESSASSNRGIGLGLYVCRMLVEAHDGRIWVESKPGKGSTFYFTLPIRAESP
jgi:signal transduction histidine kinase